MEGALDVLVAFEEVADGEELDAGEFVAGGALRRPTWCPGAIRFQLLAGIRQLAEGLWET